MLLTAGSRYLWQREEKAGVGGPQKGYWDCRRTTLALPNPSHTPFNMASHLVFTAVKPREVE